MKLARGRLAKTYTKIEKAKEKGRLKARTEDEAKTFTNKKHFLVWLKKMLEANVSEIPKIAAIIGLTILIKGLIDWTQGVFSIAVERTLHMPFPFGFGLEWKGGPPAIKIGDETQLQEWVLSYVCAYIIIEHGGSLFGMLGEGVGGLTSIVGLLLG